VPALFAIALALAGVGPAHGATPTSLMRVEVHIAPGAHASPHMLLFTLGGPIYCRQLATLARNEHASLVCADYGPNRYEGVGGRAGRLEDWGDPGYLALVAKVPATLRAEGIKISKLVFVGVSYSGYANAELVATHPEIHADALIVVDSYLDLAARFVALPRHHETRAEMETVLGGTPATQPAAYSSRSPSHHLLGLAEAIHHGMHLVVVWSTSPEERREFRGATCSRLANAQWLARLATTLNQPVTGYVTQLPHAHALWDRGEGLLALAGVATTTRPLLAKAARFGPGAAPPPGSYC
jgi:pimeloyl-ACP methyl ester carboxylesterase